MDRKIKKRKYSRKGCAECKRRKIKCDEAEPECFNCTRLKKRCVYFPAGSIHLPEPGPGVKQSLPSPPEPQNRQQPRSPPEPSLHRRSLVSLRSQPLQQDESLHPHSPHPEPSPDLPPGFPPQLHEATSSPSQHFQQPLNALSEPSGPTSALSLDSDPQISAAAVKSLCQEASVLVSDIHQFLETDQWAPAVAPERMRSPNAAFETLADFPNFAHSCMSPAGITEQLSHNNSELIDRVVADNNLPEVHTEYLRTLTTTDLAYHLFPFASSVESNEVVKVLLTYAAQCPYLMTSLLAISAAFQFNRTGQKCHESARQNYTVLCFSALTAAFAENAGFSSADSFASNVENLLLTVLVLSSTFTATAGSSQSESANSWHTHLRGARDLLVNFSRLTPRHMSQGVALAKCWFFAIEGGFITYVFFSETPKRGEKTTPWPPYNVLGPDPVECSDYELLVDTGGFDAALNPDYHRALQSIHLLVATQTSTAFNLFLGLSHNYVRLVLEFSAIREALQKENFPEVPYRWKLRLSTLVDAMYRDVIVPGVSLQTFRIPPSSEAHPEFAGNGRMSFPPSAYAMDIDESGKVYYSWYDASQQLHTDGINLRMLASKSFLGLPRTHPDVQYHIAKIFEGSFFFKKKASLSYEREKEMIVIESERYYLSTALFDNRCIMLQSVFRVLAGLVAEDEHFELIELFFMGLAKMGNGSSLSFLDVVAKIRDIRACTKEKLGDDKDDETYDFYGTMENMFFA